MCFCSHEHVVFAAAALITMVLLDDLRSAILALASMALPGIGQHKYFAWANENFPIVSCKQNC